MNFSTVLHAVHTVPKYAVSQASYFEVQFRKIVSSSFVIEKQAL